MGGTKRVNRSYYKKSFHQRATLLLLLLLLLAIATYYFTSQEKYEVVHFSANSQKGKTLLHFAFRTLLSGRTDNGPCVTCNY